MRILLQRVSTASVAVDDRVVAEIERGILLLVGFGREDDTVDAARAARRVLGLRIFPDDRDRLQYSVVDLGGDVLAVPQFTLYARTDRGRRPDFTGAMSPDAARARFEAFADTLKEQAADRVRVKRGVFGAAMAVSLVNEGPLTLQLEW